MGRNRYTPEEQARYEAYLKSAAWRAKRAARIQQAGGRCEFQTSPPGRPPVRCPRTKLLQVHHNTYERLGAEWDSDLDVYCWLHHQLEHLLWQRCNICGEPCLDNDEAAETWLLATLFSMGIDIDAATSWRGLPPKERFLELVPDKCADCCFGLS